MAAKDSFATFDGGRVGPRTPSEFSIPHLSMRRVEDNPHYLERPPQAKEWGQKDEIGSRIENWLF